ncbi:helix-turn-helix domain-containing protein [Chryseobacterium gregarium]|uniref:helix-turn-helix domain-containing protein n=1 Tax=Chryseobacterium gregarium TaxID=456299 RepID=UPI0003F8221F|nr:helix-turn-helix domain-containing protein [Chryseobacterium gregarium]
MQYIIIIGAFQALVALWLLLARDRKTSSNYLFIFLLSAIAVHLIIKFIIFNYVPDRSIRQQMNTFISVCYGPIIYLYALGKTKKGFPVTEKWYVFLPFFVLMVAYFTISGVFLILNRVDKKLLDLYNNLSLSLIFVINLYYPVKSILIAGKNKGTLLHPVEYGIIMKISCCILFIESFIPVSKILELGFPQNTGMINIVIRSFTYFTLLVICLLIIRKSFRVQNGNPAAAVLQNQTETEITDLNEETPAHTIDYELKFRELWQKLDEPVRMQKLFRDCELTLDQLALKTRINKYQISEMLNGYQKKSFYQYINEYRIGYFKSSIEEAIEKNETINFLSLAYDAGFKSKSSFNRYFKEISGKTPSEYYKNLIKNRNREVA